MTDSEILRFAIDSGIIDIATVEQQNDMVKRQEYLNMHTCKVWKGKDGYWHTYLPDGESGRKGVKRKSRKELEDEIVKYYHKFDDKPTYEEIYNRWLSDKLKYNEICKGTADRYNDDYNRFFKNSEFAKMFVQDIEELDIERFVRDNIIEKGLKRKAFSNLRTILLGTFKYAKKYGYTKISISGFFNDLELSHKMFRQERVEPRKQVFNEDEIPMIIDYIDKHPNVGNLGILLDFQTGLRSGELAAIKYSDIEGDEIHIQRQEILERDEDGKPLYRVVEYTKTDAGDRYVYLNEGARKILKRIRELNPFGEYIMMEDGKKLRKYIFNCRLRTICRACNIPKRTMHKIRKTYGTVLIDSGLEDSLIMGQMGHADIKTTRSYYYFANKNNSHKKSQFDKVKIC